MITNLIRNSVDALDGVQRREIVISTRHAGQDSIEITVADSGPGLADRLFHPFVTTKPTGLGIGSRSAARLSMPMAAGSLRATIRAAA